MFQSGFVAIVGRPNTGKSTLLNRMVGQKIAIVTHKAQTTRDCIRGILSEENYQVVFLDTPGIIRSRNKLEEYMNRSRNDAREGADCTLAMLDAQSSFGPTDRAMLEGLSPKSTVVVINKIDGAEEEKIAALQKQANDMGFPCVFPISAKEGHNTQELLAEILLRMPEGPAYFPPDMPADFTERFLCGEIIREKLLLLLEQEVPHDTGVEVVKMEETPGLTRISADIICARAGHKAIIIGKGGAKIKEIGSQARTEIEEILEQKVFLELFVKVEPDWQNRQAVLKQLGYR